MHVSAQDILPTLGCAGFGAGAGAGPDGVDVRFACVVLIMVTALDPAAGRRGAMESVPPAILLRALAARLPSCECTHETRGSVRSHSCVAMGVLNHAGCQAAVCVCVCVCVSLTLVACLAAGSLSPPSNSNNCPCLHSSSASSLVFIGAITLLATV